MKPGNLLPFYNLYCSFINIAGTPFTLKITYAWCTGSGNGTALAETNSTIYFKFPNPNTDWVLNSVSGFAGIKTPFLPI